MDTIDVFVRAIALSILLFIAAFLPLSFSSFWWETVHPLRYALTFAALSVGLAGSPLLLIYLTRAAGGATTDRDARARYFGIFVVFVVISAVLVGSLMVFGQIGV